jgi:hypothetical protein
MSAVLEETTVAPPLVDAAYEFVGSRLDRLGPVPASLRAIVARACLCGLDSAQIVEGLHERRMLPPAPALDAHTDPALKDDISRVVRQIEDEGLVRHFRALMLSFARLTLATFADPAQAAKARQWRDEGYTSSFLMTDRGGPAIQNWRTVYSETTPGVYQLRIDKEWAMEGTRPGFAFVVARAENALSPTIFLLGPEACGALKRTPSGPAFLDGTLQLGNVSGVAQARAEDRIMKAGPASSNRLLTSVRPQLVRALMAQLLWLDRTGGCRLLPGQVESARALLAMATTLADQPTYSIDTVTQVMALKFASNSLLADCVFSGEPATPAIARDLMAFTKMEGSSYRCFKEIYSRR